MRCLLAVSRTAGNLCSTTNPQMASAKRLCYKPFARNKVSMFARAGIKGEGMEHFQRNAEPDVAAFVAIDWADTEHVWSMQARLDERRETGRIHHSPESV